MTKLKALASQWKESSNSIWLFSAINIRRNIKNYKFPSKMSSEEKRSVGDAVHHTLKKFPKIKKPSYLPASNLDPTDKDYLYEHYLSPVPLQNLHEGEGIIIDSKGKFMCLLNYMDHLRLGLVDDRNDLFEIWKELVAYELYLEKEVGFSFNSRFGFLTAHPEKCGTGMDVRVFLHLPASIYSGEIERFTKTTNEMIELKSMEGGHDNFIGDLVVLENRQTLGLKEETLMSQIQEFALKLVVQEKSTREALKSSEDPKLFDLVGRAFGLLKHSYQMDMHEAFNALGKIRLGLDLGWVKNISHKQLNKLLFASRRGHLSLSSGLDFRSREEVNRERATFFRKGFKRVSLKE